MTYKLQVSRILKEVSLLLQLRGESPFKARAYDIAADRILGLQDELQTWVDSGRLGDLPGIGPALTQAITEIVHTGALRYHQDLTEEFPTSLLSLLAVPEIGAKKAAQLWKMRGIADVNSLEAACHDGRLQGLKGFGPKSIEKIIAALQRHRTTENQFRLGQILPVAEGLMHQLSAVKGVERVSLAGSARRFRETVSDIDLVVAAENAAAVFEAFTDASSVAQSIAHGASKCSVRLKEGNLQVDLRVLPPGDFSTALHHFTGSKAHHIRLRGLAKARDLKISEWGVFKGGMAVEGGLKIDIKEEAELYRLLDMQYVPPELREDRGEVEAALAGTLPPDLIVESDLKGIVHAHTQWSDGRHNIQEMALSAKAAGYQYLTITDHSQSAFYAGGIKADALSRQWDEIDRVNEEVGGITLLKGSEVDILENGELDFPEHLLAKLEVVIGSVHQRFQMDEEQMTRRILKAFDNPHLHILGHPTGRLILKRPAYGLQMEKIFEKAAKNNIAVELNGSPHRLDLNAEHTRQALSHGVRLVLSTDAHSVTELNNVRFAVGTARRGWVTKTSVLNTLHKDPFLASLRPQ